MTCSENVVKEKTPSGGLDYKFDWKPVTNGARGAIADWLAPGETIATYVITVPSGITLDSHSKTDSDTAVTMWLSGGTVPNLYDTTCYIETDSTPVRKETMTMTIKMVEKKP